MKLSRCYLSVTILQIITGIIVFAATPMKSLNTMNYRFGIVVEKEFTNQYISDFETSTQTDVMGELRTVWAALVRQHLEQLPLKVEFHTRPDVILRKDLTAVLLVASCENIWRLYNNSDDTGSLLYLAITEPDCPRLPSDEGFTVPLVQRGFELSQIMSDLRASEEISCPSVLLITDASLDPEKLKRIYKSISEAQLNVRYVQPKVHHLDLGYFTSKDKDFIKKSLEEYPKIRRISHFIVMTSRENTYVVMEAAKSLGMVQPTTQWLYSLPESEYDVTQNDSSIISILHEGDNVALLINSTHRTTKDNSCVGGGLLCYAQQFLRELVSALAVGALNEQDIISRATTDEFEFELLSVKQRRQTLLNHIKKGISKQLEMKCDGCVAWKMRSSITWGLKGPAGANGPENATMIDVGLWRPGSGVAMMDPLFPHVKHGFRGQSLTVVSCHYPPWHEISNNISSGQKAHYSGFVFDVLDELASRLNFTYRVVFAANTVRGFAAQGRDPTPEDLQTIADERSSQWEQMIDLVQQNQVFMAAAALSMSAGREMRVNFTLALASQPHSFLIAKPRQMSRTLLFLTPFTSNAWFCIWSSVLVVGPILFLVHRLSSKYVDNTPTVIVDGDAEKFGGLNKVMNCIWYVYGALLQQGATVIPKADSTRLVVGIWWLFVLVVVTSYCGNLVAFLTFPRMQPPVTTLYGLQRMRGRISWGLLRGSALETLLEDSTVPEYTKLLNSAERHANVDDELLHRIEYENHVLLDRRSRLLALQSMALKTTGYCAFAIANDDFLPEQVGLAMPLQSPYLPLVNKEIRRMQQAGLTDLWLRAALPRRDRCWVTLQSLAQEVNNHSVNLDDMQGSFFVLFLGFFAAFTVLLLERCWSFALKLKDRGLIQPFTN